MDTRVFIYNITKGAASYLLALEAESHMDAIAKIMGIEGDGVKAEYMEVRNGTLEDYLGEDSMARLAVRRKRAKKTADSRKYKAEAKYTPAEGATRART